MININLRDALAEEQRARGAKIAMTTRVLTLTMDEFYEDLVQHGTTASKADAIAVLKNIGTTLARVCGRGEAVNIDGLGCFAPRAHGVKERDGTWSKPLTAEITWTPSIELNKAFQANVSFEEREPIVRRPHITQVTDAVTRTTNSQLTAGGMIELKGFNCKMHLLMSDERVFLIPAEGGDPIPVTLYLQNSPKRIICQMPDGLQAGDSYRLEVRARSFRCKTLRSSDFQTIFTIA